MSDAETPDQRLTEQVRMLYRLTDACVAARHRKLLDAIPNPERLSRAERANQETENLLLARREFAQRLRDGGSRFPAGVAAWVGGRTTVARSTVRRRPDRDRLGVLEETGAGPGTYCGGGQPLADPGSCPATSTADDPGQLGPSSWGETGGVRAFASVRGRRDRDCGTRRNRIGDLADVPLGMLTAADRAQELEESLRQWTQQPGADHRWRRGLGYLLAERGRIAEAIAVFEAIEAEEPLDATDCRVLAGWYLAAGQRERYERATLQAVQPFDERQLDNWLNDQLQRWESENGPPPSQLDEGVLHVLRAMLEQLGDDDDGSGGHADQRLLRRHAKTTACRRCWPTAYWEGRRARPKATYNVCRGGGTMCFRTRPRWKPWQAHRPVASERGCGRRPSRSGFAGVDGRGSCRLERRPARPARRTQLWRSCGDC